MEKITDKILGSKEENKNVLNKFLNGSDKKKVFGSKSADLIGKDDSEKYVKKII